MTSFRLRPRFQHLTPLPPIHIESLINQRLKSNHSSVVGMAGGGIVILKIKDSERHYWSPQLQLSLEATPDGTLIHGLYGPNPVVWSMFFLGYGAIGIASLFISIIGFSRKTLGMEAPVLWWLLLLGGMALFLYVIAQLGQKRGAEQTFTLHHFYEEMIDDKVPIF